MDAQGFDGHLACTLGSDDASAQLAAWAGLRGSFQRGETTAGGVRLWFDSTASEPLRAVATSEAACCAFLRLEVGPDGDLTRLQITSDHADARPVIALLATRASGHVFE